MAGYNELKGLRVKYLSADPANPEDGQVWYNSTTGNLRVQGIGVGAWSSGSPLAQPRARNQGAGTQTAGLTFGGKNGSVYNNTEEYNGSGWTTGGTLPSTVFDHAGDGVQTSAFSAGGIQTDPGTDTNASAEYDGTSWTAGGNLTTARKKLMGLGSSNTAGLVFGGEGAPNLTLSEEYNGTAWTEGNNLNTGRAKGAGSGTQTAGLGFGGYVPGPSARLAATETYDGTSWSSVNNLNTGRSAAAGFGTQTSSLTAGGYDGTSRITTTETWDGTNWSTSPATLATATDNFSGSGTTSAGWVAGGYTPSVTGATEEYNFSSTTVTPAAWSSGGAFPTASSQVAGAGPRDAALGIGGYPEGSPPTGKSYEYNGVAWSTEATLNPSTGTAGVNAAAGTQTACINTQNTAGGAPFSYTAAGEYDGTSWTNAATRPADSYSNAGAGTLTAGLFFGGTSSPTGTTNATVSYDGTNWTVESPLNTGRSELAGSGVQTAALGSGGYSNPPATFYASTEEYNGTSWTTVNSLNTETRNGKSSGFQTDAIIMGGRNPGPVNTGNSFRYDGTVWSTAPSMATARNSFGNGATSPVGAAWGSAGYYPGSSPNRTNTTEHFNVETVAVNPANNLSVS